MPDPALLLSRYRVRRRLGRGGSGVVYEVDDLCHPGTVIAAKTLEETSSADRVERLRQEFKTLQRLGHPNLVRVHDLHTVPGTRPFLLTLERVNGRPFLEVAGGLPVPAALELLGQVCGALGHLHARGQVHRDIKSENILVEEQGGHRRAVLMDLGLAGADGLSLAGPAGGTLHYLPPEVLEGKAADRRGDLYSLGVLAYRMLTGSFPFRAAGGRPVAEAIRESRHLSLHQAAPHLAPDLCAVIERLLNRDPDRRFQEALEVWEALRAHAGGGSRPATPVPARDWPFVGREREKAQVQRLVDRMGPLHGRPEEASRRCVLIEGEAGIGKSRLVGELRAYCQLAGLPFARAACRDLPRTPLAGIRQVVRQLIPWARARLAGGDRSCHRLLEEYAPFLEHLLEGRAADRSGAFTEDRATWVQDQLGRLLLDMSRIVPFVLAVEDLEAADLSTLSCLEGLLAQAEPARFLVLLTARADGAPAGRLAPIRRILRSREGARLELGPLLEGSLERLLRTLFGPESNLPPLAPALEKLTGGRPGFLELVLKNLEEKGVLAGTDLCLEGERLEEIPVPRSIHAWVRERLAACTAAEWRLLEALAVLDRPSLLGTLRRLAGSAGTPPREGDPAAGLLARGILTHPGRVPGGALSFAHTLSRQMVYAALAPARRRTLHGRAADLILEAGAARAAELANHLLEAGRSREAASWALRAGKAAGWNYAGLEAERWYRCAVEHLPPEARLERLQALESLARTLNVLSRHQEAGDLLRALVRQATEDHRQEFLARGLAGLALVSLGLSRYHEAEELSGRALRIAREICDPETEARALKAVGDTFHYQSRLEEAREAYAKLASLREALPDEAGRGLAWYNLGWVCNSMRRFDEAAHYLRLSADCYRRTGSFSRLANALCSLGANELDAGRFVPAVQQLEEAYKSARQIRTRTIEALCLVNLGEARCRLGQFVTAQGNLRQAARILTALKGIRYLANTELIMGRLLTEMADYREAEKYLASAREAFLSMENQPGLAMYLAAQGNIHRLLGDPTAARFWCERALEIARAAGDAQVTASSLTILALATFDENGSPAAIDALIEARALAREIGAEDTEHLACLALGRILLFADRPAEAAGLLDPLLEQAETRQLAADMPPVLLLQALFQARIGHRLEAARLTEEGLSRAQLASPAEARWELLQLGVLLHRDRGDAAAAGRLQGELDAWLHSCAANIPEERRREAFLRRSQNRFVQLRRLLSLPPLSAVEKAREEPRPAPRELPPVKPPRPEAPAAEPPPAPRPGDLLTPPCDKPAQAERLRAVLNLLVDRAVHQTRSSRGGLFLRVEPDPGEDPAREPPPGRSSLAPVALRDLTRESLSDAREMSRTVLEAALAGRTDVTSAEVMADSAWAESLTIRVRRIPAILALPVWSSPGAQGSPPPADRAGPPGSAELLGVLYLDRQAAREPYTQADRRIGRHLAGEVGRVLASQRAAGDTWERLEDLEAAVEQLDRTTLPAAPSPGDDAQGARFGPVRIIGTTPAMQRVFARTTRLAASRAPVLITGETGTGKELIARALHESSPWKEAPFLALDCGALSGNLAEAELFGHARGAFSGARTSRPGLLRATGEGTFFLDEIGNLDPPLQLKLLRALEAAEVRPVGEDRPVPVHCRLVAATNADLEDLIQKGRFREDLYHRLRGGLIHLPPLRSRMDDLPPLVELFLSRLAGEMDRPVPRLTPAAWQAMYRYSWPGNARELRMALQVALAMSGSPVIEAHHLPDQVISKERLRGADNRRPGNQESPGAHPPRERVADIVLPAALEGRMLLKVLAEHGWDKAASARTIGWSRQKVYRNMKAYGLPLQVSEETLQQIQEGISGRTI
ncbi:MAG: sigma 54-interacting transcriptional regulator [Acidobacteriota bacterium]